MGRVKYLLDANVWSEMARAERNAGVVRRFEAETGYLAMPAPVADELTFGVECLSNGRRRHRLREWLDHVLANYPVLAFDARAAIWHGAERARRRRLGAPAPFVDGMIAAIAVSHNLSLVTHNSPDYTGFTGLRVENWFEPSL